MKIISCYIFGIFVLFTSCKKSMDEESDISEEVENCNYNSYSTSNFDFIWNDLVTDSAPTGPFTTPNAEFFYQHPVFNPLNPLQIAYERHTWPPSFNTELWVFDFCTGQSQMIADNFNYDLDWSTNGWLLFTGGGGQTYKIKPNGDSLTLLQSDYFVSETGRWNPSGTAFWRKSDNATHYIDVTGNEFYINTSVPFDVSDWINDSTVVGVSNNNNLYSRVIPDGELVMLNSNTTCITCYKYYNKEDNSFYVVKENNPRKLLSYSLNGDNAVDTVKNTIKSYHYGKADYNQGKIITQLIRQEWADSIGDNRLYRSNILIMNSDASDERLVEIPE